MLLGVKKKGLHGTFILQSPKQNVELLYLSKHLSVNDYMGSWPHKASCKMFVPIMNSLFCI